MSVRLKDLNDVSSVSFDGDSYDVIDGFVDVPEEAVADLLSHGFILISESDPIAAEAVATKRAYRKKSQAASEPVAEAAPAEQSPADATV